MANIAAEWQTGLAVILACNGVSLSLVHSDHVTTINPSGNSPLLPDGKGGGKIGMECSKTLLQAYEENFNIGNYIVFPGPRNMHNFISHRYLSSVLMNLKF